MAGMAIATLALLCVLWQQPCRRAAPCWDRRPGLWTSRPQRVFVPGPCAAPPEAASQCQEAPAGIPTQTYGTRELHGNTCCCWGWQPRVCSVPEQQPPT